MTTLAIDIGGTKIAAAVCDENDAITPSLARFPHRWTPTHQPPHRQHNVLWRKWVVEAIST